MQDDYERDDEYVVEFPAVIRVPLIAYSVGQALARGEYYLPVDTEGVDKDIYNAEGFISRLNVPSFALGVKVFRLLPDGTKEEVTLG